MLLDGGSGTGRGNSTANVDRESSNWSCAAEMSWKLKGGEIVITDELGIGKHESHDVMPIIIHVLTHFYI
jgi:hypothetical protein